MEYDSVELDAPGNTDISFDILSISTEKSFICNMSKQISDAPNSSHHVNENKKDS